MSGSGGRGGERAGSTTHKEESESREITSSGEKQRELTPCITVDSAQGFTEKRREAGPVREAQLGIWRKTPTQRHNLQTKDSRN